MQHGQENQLMKLRIKYDNAILWSQLNHNKNQILREGKELYVQAASRKHVNPVIQSSQPSQEERPTNTNAAQPHKKKKSHICQEFINYIWWSWQAYGRCLYSIWKSLDSGTIAIY